MKNYVGVIQLLADTQVCKKGDVLTPEQCRILELFEIKMAEFRIAVDCVWENGEFVRLATDPLVHTHSLNTRHPIRTKVVCFFQEEAEGKEEEEEDGTENDEEGPVALEED